MPRRAATAGALVVVLVSSLSACVDSPPVAPAPAPSSTGDTSVTPTLIPDGDATANLPYFDAVTRALLAEVPDPDGRQLVDHLAEAGFGKPDMEVTPDVTVGDKPVGNIQFSVRINDSCLIGQSGTAGYNALAAPLLGTGKCLVGTTRTIDW